MLTHGFEPHQCYLETLCHLPSGLKSPTCYPDRACRVMKMSFGGVAWPLFRCHYKHSPDPLTGLPLSNIEEVENAYGAYGLRL